jgi:hypothetical protein
VKLVVSGNKNKLVADLVKSYGAQHPRREQ